MDPLRSVARNASVLAASRVVSRLLTFGLSIALARGLGARDYGIYALAAAVMTLVVAVCDYGLSPYITREVARNREALDAGLRRILGIRGALAVAGAVPVAGWVLLEPSTALARAVGILYLGITFESVAYLGFAYMQGLERMRFEAAVVVAANMARTVGGITLVVVTGSLEAVLGWLALVSLGQLVAAAFCMRAEGVGRRSTAPPPPLRVLFGSGTALMLVVLSSAVILRADSVIIGAVDGAHEVGLYTAAYALVTGVQMIPWILSVALYPVLARTFGREQSAFRSTWDGGIRAAVLLTLPAALLASTLADPIIDRIYGSSFADAAGALEILMWWIPLAGVAAILAALMRAAGKEGRLAWIVCAGAVANVALNLVIVPRHGFVGAAAVTVALEAVMLVAMVILVARLDVPAPALGFLARALPAAIGLCATALALRPAPVEIAVVAGVAIYGLLLLAFGAVSRRELTLVGRALGPAVGR